jgi:hypothetical protein
VAVGGYRESMCRREIVQEWRTGLALLPDRDTRVDNCTRGRGEVVVSCGMLWSLVVEVLIAPTRLALVGVE